MRWIVLSLVASLAALFLYPIVLNTGKRIGQAFNKVEDQSDPVEPIIDLTPEERAEAEQEERE